MVNTSLKLFEASQENTDFFLSVCSYLQTKPSSIIVEKFNDKDTHVVVDESLSGCNAFIFQSYIPPIGERLYELMLAISGAKSRGPDSVTVVFPFHFGCRGERRTRSGEAVNLNAVIKMVSDADRVITLDPHTESISTAYDHIGVHYIPLVVNPLLVDYYMRKFFQDKEFTGVSLDYGGVKNTRKISNKINERRKEPICNIAIIDKDRYAPNQSKGEYIIGELRDRGYSKEDIIDTGGTMLKGCEMLKEAGMSYISTYATHGIFSRNALDEFLTALNKGTIDELIIGDTIQLSPMLTQHKKVKVLSLAPLVGEAIKRVHEKRSTSELYKHEIVIGIYQNLNDLKKISIL